MHPHRTDRRAAAAGLLVAALLSFGLVAPTMAAGAAPTVDDTDPSDGDTNVALDAAIAVFFSETVNVADGWFSLVCTTSGTHNAAVIPSGAGFVFLPDQAFVPNESCTFTVIAAFVTDSGRPTDVDGRRRRLGRLRRPSAVTRRAARRRAPTVVGSVARRRRGRRRPRRAIPAGHVQRARRRRGFVVRRSRATTSGDACRRPSAAARRRSPSTPSADFATERDVHRDDRAVAGDRPGHERSARCDGERRDRHDSARPRRPTRRRP